MNVLCVDDSATLRKIVSITLTGSGHKVIEAENGLIGLEKLETNPVDCILLDINMPEMGGIDFLKEKAGSPKHAGVPVIVLTTESEAEMRNTAMELGASGYLAKPFRKEEILAALESFAGK